VAVDIHPGKQNQSFLFDGLGLRTSAEIDWAYTEAEAFSELLGQRTRASGFMKNLILQRICSSIASGRSTAHRLLNKDTLEELEDTALISDLAALTFEEKHHLERIISYLSQKPEDPKLEAVHHYLTHEKWLDLGCIIFSQYFDTANWIADSLAKKLPQTPIALYAGAGQSKVFKEGAWTRTEREVIKKAVRDREIPLVVATDAACEGLNLQTLGTLINVDLPWNPSRLEQRLGRIKRYGQSRRKVDMLNLVYQGTRDEDVYNRLSERMKDRYDIFGNLPDVLDDEWIEDIENWDRKMSEYIESRKHVNAFELRYGSSIWPVGDRWEICSKVLARRDIIEKLSQPW
jgi:ERCC4-related helicase